MPYKRGKPRIWSEKEPPEKLEAAIAEYFNEVEKKKEPPSICELALHLGFADRSSLKDYIHRGDEYSLPIKKAYTYIEAYWEKALKNGGSGSIFWLKNHNWADKQEHGFTNRAGDDLLDPKDAKLLKRFGIDVPEDLTDKE